MRATFAISLEFNLDRSLPGFFDSLAQYPVYDKLDRGAFVGRQELMRVECEIPEGEEGHAQQAIAIYGERLADSEFPEHAGPCWRNFGRIIVERLTNNDLPSWVHGSEGANPAIRCPVCSGPMKLRNGIGGSIFWGCPDYPSCRGRRPISK
jgi:hypothetical protein